MRRSVGPSEAEAALRWLDPIRDTALARDVAQRLIANGQTVRCVWTDGPLRPDSLDIDHCLPWAAWPCGDLWNLVPARSSVNRNAKRDRLPSAAALDGMEAWWQQAWEADEALAGRFWTEVDAALRLDKPATSMRSSLASSGDVYAYDRISRFRSGQTTVSSSKENGGQL